MDNGKKILIGLFVIAIVMQVFFMYKRIHNYPFMIYDMYSRKEMPNEFTELYTIIVNDDTLSLVKLPMLQEGLLVNSLHVFQQHNENGVDTWDSALTKRQNKLGATFTKRSNVLLKNSAYNVNRYPIWLANYIQRNCYKDKVHQLKVYVTTLDNKHGFNFDEVKIIDVKIP